LNGGGAGCTSSHVAHTVPRYESSPARVKQVEGTINAFVAGFFSLKAGLLAR
jgi:hypothetical protein